MSNWTHEANYKSHVDNRNNGTTRTHFGYVVLRIKPELMKNYERLHSPRLMGELGKYAGIPNQYERLFKIMAYLNGRKLKALEPTPWADKMYQVCLDKLFGIPAGP